MLCTYSRYFHLSFTHVLLFASPAFHFPLAVRGTWTIGPSKISLCKTRVCRCVLGLLRSYSPTPCLPTAWAWRDICDICNQNLKRSKESCLAMPCMSSMPRHLFLQIELTHVDSCCCQQTGNPCKKDAMATRLPRVPRIASKEAGTKRTKRRTKWRLGQALATESHKEYQIDPDNILDET